MKRCIGSAKPHRTVFRFFARYYDAEEEIHKRISWNWENISKSGPKVRPKLWKIESLMKRCIGSANLIEPFFAFSQDITMLKKRFISAFPEIEKISQNLVRKVRPKIMKNWIFNEKVHRIRKTSQNRFRFFARYYDAEEVIHKRISWNWENISKSGPKVRPKLWKIESLMKRCIGSAKPHRTVFRFFARYYDAEEVIHKRISWNWENISKSGPKVRPKIMTNWIFNEKVHRIRKTSQNRFSLFRKILRCWRSDS